MSPKVEVFASPGWEAEVDTDWAEGLFAVFLRSARGRRRGPKGATKVIAREPPGDGVILVSLKEESGESPASPSTPPTGSRRARRPRGPEEATAKVGTRTREPAARPKSRKTDLGHRSGTNQEELAVRPPLLPPGKQMSPEETASFLREMATLVKYGHREQVRSEVDRRLVLWPEDLQLRTILIDFFTEKGLVAETVDALFGLAALYFDRRDLRQMRACLDRILKLDPSSKRAKRMRELLERRPGRARPATNPGR